MKGLIAGLILVMLCGLTFADDTDDTSWKIQRLVESYEEVCLKATKVVLDYHTGTDKVVTSAFGNELLESEFLRYAISTAASHRMTAVPIEPTITDTTTYLGLYQNWYCKIVDFPGGYKDSLMVIFNINGCIDTVRSSTKRGLVDKATQFVRDHTVYVDTEGGDGQ